MIGLKWKPDKSLVISVYREYLRFLIHFNFQEEFMTAVDMDEFLEIRNIWVINVYSEVEKEVEEE